MLLLITFAFLAGIVTILSPCILPILPIILSSSIGGKTIGKSRAIGVVAGFIASFTFFTLFLSSIVSVLKISAETLRFASVFVIAGFGVSLLVPQFQLWLEQLFAKLSAFVPRGNTQAGFFPGLIVGLSVGLLWTPCVGPILAAVISLAITGSVSTQAVLITLAYAVGTALPMFLIILAGQNALKKVPWLLKNTQNIQKAFGIVMIATAIGIFFNIDRTFQTFILNKFPSYGTGLTQFEDIAPIQNELKKITGQDTAQETRGQPMFNVLNQKGVKAAEIIPGGKWFNPPSPTASEGQVLASLRGKVILIDFWTYTCINCQRTLPYLKNWYEKYKDKGLVIIGVHSPEFEFEKSAANVQKAITDFGLTYPIVQDNDFATWRAYNNRYWPAKYLVDKDGFIRYTHFGEGAYDETERVIQELLTETGAQVSLPVDNPESENNARTPELYLGFDRLQYLDSTQTPVLNQGQLYELASTPPQLHHFAFAGKWMLGHEYAAPTSGGLLKLNFSAQKVFLVMRPTGTSTRVKVTLDGQTIGLGSDVVNGMVTVDADRLYELVNLSGPGNHILNLEFLDGNIELYAFTFG